MSSTNIEREVKFLIDGSESIESVIKSLGAKLTQPRTYEINYQFDTIDHSLEKEKKILRLRQDSANRLTFKGPGEITDGIHTRHELEVAVNDLESAKNILKALGYQVSMIYEKYRMTYHLDDTEIMLDEMPFGFFVELEGQNSGEMQSIAEKCSLDWNARILLSYGELFDILKASLGLTFRDLTFNNFDDIQVGPDDFRNR